MEREFKTLGIVIASLDRGERNKEYTLFTPERGNIKLLSFGAKSSKKAPKVMLYSEGVFSLSEKNEGKRVTLLDVDILTLHEGLYSSFLRLSWASLFSEMIEKSKDTDSSLYSLYSSTLDSLEEDNPDRVAIYFLVKYLSLMGIFGSYKECPMCGRKYTDDEIIGFSTSLGTSVCLDCDDNNSSLILPPSARKYLSRVKECEKKEALSLIISDEMAHKISRNLVRGLLYSFPSHLNTIDSGIL